MRPVAVIALTRVPSTTSAMPIIMGVLQSHVSLRQL
jgi:hypothetical protein